MYIPFVEPYGTSCGMQMHAKVLADCKSVFLPKEALDVATELHAALALSEVQRIAADIKRIGKQCRRNCRPVGRAAQPASTRLSPPTEARDGCSKAKRFAA
ncbi:hypothetical protein OKW35_008332 [Paraburkholderia sp. MM5477-R1]